VSYENSFSAIKRDIYKETVEKNTKKVKVSAIQPIEEKPPGTSVKFNRNAPQRINGSNKSKDHQAINEYLSKGNP